MRPAARHAAGLGFMAVGAGVVLTVVLALNNAVNEPPSSEGGPMVAFDAPPAQKPPASRPRPRPRAAPKTTAPPAPALAASLAGLDLGVGLGAQGLGLEGELLGEQGPVVMTEDSVDSLPEPQMRVEAPYPARARAKGLTGYVTLSVLISAEGGVDDVQVLEASPSGVFEESAVSALRQWRFSPALYQGAPVAVRVRQTLRFELG